MIQYKKTYSFMEIQKYFDIGDTIKFIKGTPVCNEYGQSKGSVIDQYSIGKVEAYKDKFTKEVLDDIVKIEIKSGDKELIGKHVWVKISDCPKSSISQVY